MAGSFSGQWKNSRRTPQRLLCLMSKTPSILSNNLSLQVLVHAPSSNTQGVVNKQLTTELKYHPLSNHFLGVQPKKKETNPPRSLGGGGFPGRAGSAFPATSGLSCCHEFVSFFADTGGVFAVSSDVGIGLLGVWVRASAVIL